MLGSRRAIVTLGSLLLPWLAAGPVSSDTAGSGPGNEFADAVAGDHRDDDERARDRYRHPVATLEFFGLEADMTVIEIWPGSGWYTSVLAPVLRTDGKLIVATFSEAPPDYRPREYQALRQRMNADPQIYNAVEVVLYEPPKRTRLGPPDSADMVVTFRNSHNWVNHDIADTVFAGMFAVLKPGGILGLVQHRGFADADPETSAEAGYVPEGYLIALAEGAGFVLEDRSEINANPKDVKDYSRGVWTLPPTLSLGDDDSERYMAIGESDRMTLRFVKPNDQD